MARLRFVPMAMMAITAFVCSSAFAQGASPAASNPGTGVQNTMAQRMQACVVCHGKEGRATNAGYFPRIAGKPAGYLYNQLKNFQDGRRRNVAMNHLVAHMSDDYLRAIARYFSESDLPYPPPQASTLTPQEVAMAQALVLDGAPQRRIPACVACHGGKMAGKLPATPGLLGLPADYLLAQFGSWRAGQRSAKAPDCMGEIARRLTPQEIGTVARWLSTQTLPTGTQPEAAGAAPLPLQCGSGQQ
jgi:cytochrome c553